MSLQVCKDSSFLHALWHDPDIYPYMILGAENLPDAKDVMNMDGTVFLANEHGGFLYVFKEPGIWEVHTQFKKSGRGPHVIDLARESTRFMFERTPCLAITTFVEKGNEPARRLALSAWFEEIERCEIVKRKGVLYMLTVKRWVQCQPLQ